MRNFLTGDSSYDADKEALRRLSLEQIKAFAIDIGEIVLPVWEETHPADTSPRELLNAVKRGEVPEVNPYSFLYGNFPEADNARDAIVCASLAFKTPDASLALDYVTDALTWGSCSVSDVGEKYWDQLYQIYLQAYNDGFRFDPRWATLTIKELASNKEDYPILLDALEDQGCSSEYLKIARDSKHIYRSDWVLSHVGNRGI